MPKKQQNKSNKQTKKKVVIQVAKKSQNKPKKQVSKQKVTVIGEGMRQIGGAVGSYFGVPGVGRALGAGISRIFGQGDYSMNKPLRNSLMSGGVPSFSPLTSGFRVRHREYIQDISSSVGFTALQFPINPGMNALFPWLAQVAVNFEEYKIHGMVVYLNTLSGVAVASTNTALGLWGAVTQYDPTEPDFINKQQAENYVGCQTTVPSCSLIHGIECVPNSNILNKMYVRSGAIPDGEDLKFYDWGKLQIFTQGSQNVNTIGEMWVSYDIEFTKPRLPTGGANVVYTDRYNVISAPVATPLGVASMPATGSNLGTSVNALGTTITIPATAPNTNYLMTVKWDASTSVALTSVPAWTLGGPLVPRNIFANNTSNVSNSPQATVTQRWVTTQLAFSKTGSTTGAITLSSLGFVFITANVEIVITQMSNTLIASLADRIPLKLDYTELAWLHEFIEKSRNREFHRLPQDIDDILLEKAPVEEEKEDELGIVSFTTPLKE